MSHQLKMQAGAAFVALGFFILGIAVGRAADALVVSTCGTLRQQYPVGETRQITVDTNGKTCT